MKRIFFSYAHDDSEVAQQLHANLHDAEVSGWMDQADVASGEAIAHRIRESIRTASALVVLVSPRSIDSQWVQFEVGAAWAMGKRIIPIVIGDADTEARIPDWISQFAFLDARNRPMQDVAREVVSVISAE